MKVNFLLAEAKRNPSIEFDPFHAEDAFVEAACGVDVGDGQNEMIEMVDLRRPHRQSATALSHDGTVTLG